MNNKNARWLCLATLLAVLTACDDPTSRNGDSRSGATSQPVETQAYTVRLANVEGEPIAGATVTLAATSGRYEATTGADGVATFTARSMGVTNVSVGAAGYEPVSYEIDLSSSSRDHGITLNALEAWATGRAIVLGTRMVARALDGSAMTFSIDIAVIDKSSAAIETLTGADFSVEPIDCGWGGPRDCASDRDGNATGNWYRSTPAELALQPPRVRQPYRVRVLAVRDHGDAYWSAMAPALKSFFAQVAGNDSVSLSSVLLESGTATHTVHGPFTNDGSVFFEAIDALANANGDEPAIVPSLAESIVSVAGPGADASVVVLVPPGLPVADVNSLSTLARQVGVHVSTVDFFESYGVPELAPRTGGFVAQVDDLRQIPIVIGALDRLLAGDLPFYRMGFALTADRGTFVEGGNAKVRIKVDVPTVLPTRGVWVTADVAIE
jgi:hypothetical protein